MSASDFSGWVERVAGRRVPIGAQPSQELAAALLDTLARDVTPLALESAGLARLAARFRQLAPLGAPSALAAARPLAEEAMRAMAQAGRPHLFLSSFSQAATELERAWASPGAAAGLFGASGFLEMAFLRVAHAGAGVEAVREQAVRTLERFLPLSAG